MEDEERTKAEVTAGHKSSLGSNSIETTASGIEEFRIEKLNLYNVRLSLSNISRNESETIICLNNDKDSNYTETSRSSGASLLAFPVESRSVCIRNICLFLTILIGFLTLFFLYIDQRRHTATQNLRVDEEGIPSVRFLLKRNPRHDHHHQQDQEYTTWQWKSFPELANSKTKLHIQVRQDHRSNNVFSGNLQDDRIKAEVADDTLAISGRPSFCTKLTLEAPREISLGNVTDLHLTNMDDCNHYLKLIMQEWKFPQIHHIKLQNVVIREIEFTALTIFIARHSETLHKVEITDSYLCHSPACDAGMIDFPEGHEFEVIVTRRKESPEWMR